MPVAIGPSSFGFIQDANSAKDATTSMGQSIVGSRTANNVSKLWIDGYLLNTATTTDSGTVIPIFCAHGANGITDSTAENFSFENEQVSGWGGGLTDTEVASLLSRCATLKTQVGR